jgi:hypothetical protein
LYFERRGYKIINLTDILAKEVHCPRPTRKDLFIAGTKIRLEHGRDVLARRAVETIRAEKAERFMVMGCRLPVEITRIKEAFPEVVVVGLCPDSDKVMAQLQRRYPGVETAHFRKWIAWNDGQAEDGYTNVQMCLQLCDVLFSGIDESAARPLQLRRIS